MSTKKFVISNCNWKLHSLTLMLCPLTAKCKAHWSIFLHVMNSQADVLINQTIAWKLKTSFLNLLSGLLSFLNGANPVPFLLIFSSFSKNNDKLSTKFDNINGISTDGMLGIWTRERRMVGADESPEQVYHLFNSNCVQIIWWNFRKAKLSKAAG